MARLGADIVEAEECERAWLKAGLWFAAGGRQRGPWQPLWRSSLFGQDSSQSN
jgi:hypothetical protein